MASSAPNRELVGRAAAILTTGEVAGDSIDLNEAWGSKVVVDFDFTLGSLTNVILRFYASVDGTTYEPLPDVGGNVSYTLTADSSRLFLLEAPGLKRFRATVQGTGTVTSSSAAFKYRYLKRGSQS